MNRNRLLLNVIVALILGAVLTLSSWVVVNELACLDVNSCPVATLQRGFPSPWMSEQGVSRTFPFAQGVGTPVDYGGLASDMAVWSWLSFAGLLLTSKWKRGRVESPTPRGLRFLGIILGLATIAAGLVVSLLLARLFLEYSPPAVFSLSLMGYSVLILGTGAVAVAYRRSEASPWSSCLAMGALITLAPVIIAIRTDTIVSVVTYFYLRLARVGTGVAVVTLFGSFGFPFSFLTEEIIADLPPVVDVAWWAFVIDILIWSSILGAVLILVSVARVRTRPRSLGSG